MVRWTTGVTRTTEIMHIIVCSKNRLIVEATSRAFEPRLPRLTVCESGLEVLGAVEIVDADLLVVDMQTPGLSSLLILAAVRELAPDLPILAVSHRPEEDARMISHKGVSFAILPAAGEGSTQDLASTLAQLADRNEVALSRVH